MRAANNAINVPSEPWSQPVTVTTSGANVASAPANADAEAMTNIAAANSIDLRMRDLLHRFG